MDSGNYTPSEGVRLPTRTTPAQTLELTVEVRGVSHGWGPEPTLNEALTGIDIDAADGEFISIVGPSGCGKSTLLSLISGLTDPTKGDVSVLGSAPAQVRAQIGFVFQRDALLPWRTAVQNVSLPLRFRGVPKKQAREQAQVWLDRVGLRGIDDQYPHQLSGGMRKRVAIAATLVYEPRILLMDEPYSALDVQNRNLMENDLLDVWSETRQTVVFITHDLEEAVGLSDRVIVLSASPGRVIGDHRIDLARPRNLLELRYESEFRDVCERIWQQLRVEVTRAAQQAELPDYDLRNKG